MKLFLHIDTHSFRNLVRRWLRDPVVTLVAMRWKFGGALFLLTCSVLQSSQEQPEEKQRLNVIFETHFNMFVITPIYF